MDLELSFPRRRESAKKRIPAFAGMTAMLIIRFVSLFFRALGWRACRFYPSCSVYAQQALEQKNFFSATGFIVKRVFRCHPFSAGGYDPVPSASAENRTHV